MVSLGLGIGTVEATFHVCVSSPAMNYRLNSLSLSAFVNLGH